MSHEPTAVDDETNPLTPSTKQRIWELLKKTPDLTPASIADILGMGVKVCEQVMLSMYARSMVCRKLAARTGRGRRPFVYAVPGTMLEYELLPATTMSPPEGGSSTEDYIRTLLTAVETNAAQSGETVRSMVDNLTVSEARNLQARLATPAVKSVITALANSAIGHLSFQQALEMQSLLSCTFKK